MMRYIELVPAQASALVPHAYRLRLAAAACLARFKVTARVLACRGIGSGNRVWTAALDAVKGHRCAGFHGRRVMVPLKFSGSGTAGRATRIVAGSDTSIRNRVHSRSHSRTSLCVPIPAPIQAVGAQPAGVPESP